MIGTSLDSIDTLPDAHSPLPRVLSRCWMLITNPTIGRRLGYCGSWRRRQTNGGGVAFNEQDGTTKTSRCGVGYMLSGRLIVRLLHPYSTYCMLPCCFFRPGGGEGGGEVLSLATVGSFSCLSPRFTLISVSPCFSAYRCTDYPITRLPDCPIPRTVVPLRIFW